MSYKIIGVTGLKRHGKNTIAEYFVKHHNYTMLQFAEPLKDVCKLLFHFTEEQVNGDQKEQMDPYWKVVPRKTMQWLGTDIFRKQIHSMIPEVDDRFWIKLMEKRIQDIWKHNTDQKIVISDVRFQNEVEFIKSLSHDSLIIKVVRGNTKITDVHISELSILQISEDNLIYNDTNIENLYKKLENM
jgi:hypothetical protein